MGTGEGLLEWRVPRRVLRVSVLVAAVLLVPLVVASVVGGVPAAVCVALGYVAALPPARMVATRHAFALLVPAVLAGIVAAGLNGDALPAACFAALACLAAAPANALANGLMAGVPTAAAVLAATSAAVTSDVVAIWMTVGGVVAVALVSRLGTPAAPPPIDLWNAWVHASAMALAVGPLVGLLALWNIPHGYWLVATLTVVLRPVGSETVATARQRILGTVLGAVVALATALALPEWAALAVAAVLLVLLVASALLDRATQNVAFLTMIIVLVGSGGGWDAVGTALDRVVMTLIGAAVACLVALWVARLTRRRGPHSVPVPATAG